MKYYNGSEWKSENLASPTKDGLMPKEDKATLDGASQYGKEFLANTDAEEARDSLGLSAGATSIAGSASELNTGTDTTTRVWTPKVVSDYVKSGDNRVALNALDFGVSESNTNNASNFNDAVTACIAQKKELYVPPGTYKINTVFTIPSNAKIYFDNVVIDCVSNYEKMVTAPDASNINIRGHVTLKLYKSLNRARGMRITGNNIYIQSYKVEGDEVETGEGISSNLGISISGDNCVIDKFESNNVNFPIRLLNSTKTTINKVILNKFYRGIYLSDAREVALSNGKLKGGLTGVTSLDDGGLGVLMESVESDEGTSNIRINNFDIEDTIDSCIRLGGQRPITKVWLSGITARVPGGSGIKILGGTPESGSIHQDIAINDCIIEDCAFFKSATAGLIIQKSDRVTVNNIILRRKNNEYSGSRGIEIRSSSNVSITNPIIQGSKDYGIYLGGIIGNSKNITILGGQITTDSGYGIGISNRNTSWVNLAIDNYPTLDISGTAKCFKAETEGENGDGSMLNSFISFKTTANADSIVENPTGVLNSFFVVKIQGNYVNANFKNRSTWSDPVTDIIRVRKNNVWVEQ